MPEPIPSGGAGGLRVGARLRETDVEFDASLEFNSAQGYLRVINLDDATGGEPASPEQRRSLLRFLLPVDRILDVSTHTTRAEMQKEIDKDATAVQAAMKSNAMCGGGGGGAAATAGVYRGAEDDPACRTVGVLRVRYAPEGCTKPVKQLCTARFAVLSAIDSKGNFTSPEEAASLADAVSALAESVMRAAFPNGPQCLHTFISPVSGTGKSEQQWTSIARPIIDATPHSVIEVTTTHQGHATEQVEKLDVDSAKDVIVAVGGDGMAYEVVNGLRRRFDSTNGAAAAAALPAVALFPTGSGCALAKTVGVIDMVDAALAMVHGCSVRIGLFDVAVEATDDTAPLKEGGTALPSASLCTFLSIGLGFGAAVDIESERYRWMGNARFTFYALKKMAGGVPTYKMTIRYKPATTGTIPEGCLVTVDDAAESSSTAVALDSLSAVKRYVKRCTTVADLAASQAGPRPPPPASGTGSTGAAADDDWVVLDQTEFGFINADNIAYIARDMLATPFSHINDGCMDLIFTSPDAGRGDLVGAMVGMEDGTHLDDDKKAKNIRYIKCRELELTPIEGYAAVDGERIPLCRMRAAPSPMAVQVLYLPPRPEDDEFGGKEQEATGCMPCVVM